MLYGNYNVITLWLSSIVQLTIFLAVPSQAKPRKRYVKRAKKKGISEFEAEAPNGERRGVKKHSPGGLRAWRRGREVRSAGLVVENETDPDGGDNGDCLNLVAVYEIISAVSTTEVD